MKILFIGSQRFDYLQDLTYTGLIKKFGTKNIIEYKYNKKYHLNLYQYPKNIGFIPNTIFGSIFQNKNQFDMVFVASAKIDTFKSYLQIIKKIPSAIPIIFIDGGDDESIGGDLAREGNKYIYKQATDIREFDYIFKREYIINKDYAKNIFPLPFSFNFDKLPILNKLMRYDVTFWAGNNHSTRERAFKLLKDKYDCNANGTTPDKDFKSFNRKGDFYLQELARSKIALNFRGGGWDTLRYWEIPAVGRLMISQKPNIVIPNNFEHEKNVIFCSDDLSNLNELIEYYLQNNTKREEISNHSSIHIKKYHNDITRVEYILEKVIYSA